MKIVLEESDLMRIVEQHVSSNPFFNLDGKDVNVELNNEEGQPVEVTVYIEESAEVNEKSAPKRRARRSVVPQTRKAVDTKSEEPQVAAKSEEDAADEALDKQQLVGNVVTKDAPTFKEDLPKAEVIEEVMVPAKPLSKSLFA